MNTIFTDNCRTLLGVPLIKNSASDPVDVHNKHDLKRAMRVVDVNPTMRQKITENYRKAHLRLDGLLITIENPKGSIRSKEAPDGQVIWANKMPAHYGYIKGTIGADYDQVDCFIGKHHETCIVYIIDQKHHHTQKFDESKCMIWFKSMEKAVKTYMKSFSDGSGHERFLGASAMDMPMFKSWLKTNGTIHRLSKAIIDV